MECPRCTNDPCTCRTAPHTEEPKIRSTERTYAPGVTKEEFGVNLYETIKTCGGILALNEHLAVAVNRSDQFAYAEAKTKRGILVDRLREQMATLTNDEAGQIAAHYPWVAHV